MRTLFQLLGFLAMTYAMLAPTGELLAKDSKGKSGSRAGKSSGSRATKSSGNRASKSSGKRAGQSSAKRSKSQRSEASDRQRSYSSPVRKKSSESSRSQAKHEHDRDRSSSLRRSTSDRHDDDRHSGSRHSPSNRRHDDDDHHDRGRHHDGHDTRHRSSLHFGFSYPRYGSYGRSYYLPGYSTRYRYGSDYGLYGHPSYDYGTPYLDPGPAETGFYGEETQNDPALAGGEFQRRAEAAFRSGQYQEAVRWANHAVVESPDSGRHLLFLSQTLFAVGNFQAATEAVYRATELLPPEDWGYVVKNYARFYRGNSYVTQMSGLTRLMKDQPDAAYARALRGYHYAYLGYKDAARRDLARALELDAKDPLARRLSEQFGWTSPSELPPESPPRPAESPPGPAESPPGADSGATEQPATNAEPTLTNSEPPADSQ